MSLFYGVFEDSVLTRLWTNCKSSFNLSRYVHRAVRRPRCRNVFSSWGPFGGVVGKGCVPLQSHPLLPYPTRVSRSCRRRSSNRLRTSVDTLTTREKTGSITRSGPGRSHPKRLPLSFLSVTSWVSKPSGNVSEPRSKDSDSVWVVSSRKTEETREGTGV